MYSLMVVYGFLNYYEGEIRIPNKELLEKFKKVLNEESDFEIYKNLMNNSKKNVRNYFSKKYKRCL